MVEVVEAGMEDMMEATRVATVEAGVATNTKEEEAEGLEATRVVTMEDSPSTGAQVEAMVATVVAPHGAEATWVEGVLAQALVWVELALVPAMATTPLAEAIMEDMEVSLV